MSESRLELGRLGRFVEGYRVWLLERGYSPGTVGHELRFLGALGRWMVAEDLVVGQLDGEVIARGLIPLALGDAVPPVASWRDTGIPRSVAPGDVERLIASCDRSTLEGARDAAIVLLLARLGLRSIEVARMELSDLDWRAGELLVRGRAGERIVCRCPTRSAQRWPSI